jgi:hypothetical protein
MTQREMFDAWRAADSTRMQSYEEWQADIRASLRALAEALKPSRAKA